MPWSSRCKFYIWNPMANGFNLLQVYVNIRLYHQCWISVAEAQMSLLTKCPQQQGAMRDSCSWNANSPKLKIFQVLFHTFVVSQLLTAIYHHLSRSDLKRRSPKEQIKISVNQSITVFQPKLKPQPVLLEKCLI